MAQLDRITQQPEVMGGKACIRGMRVLSLQTAAVDHFVLAEMSNRRRGRGGLMPASGARVPILGRGPPRPRAVHWWL